MDDPSRKGKNVHAGDAYFCCPKSEETGLLDLGVTGTGLKVGLPTATSGDQTRVISIKMTNRTQKDFFWVRFVYSLNGEEQHVLLRFFCFNDDVFLHVAAKPPSRLLEVF